MTEAEWLACDDPGRMLNYLTHETRWGEHGVVIGPRDVPIVSDRKLRLFACACWRLRASRFGGEEVKARQLRVSDYGEALADGLPTPALERRPADVEFIPLLGDAAEAACHMAGAADAGERAVQAALLRCLAGNPGRSVALPKDESGIRVDCGPEDLRPGEIVRLTGFKVRWCPWLYWNDGAVLKLARSIYDGRDWAALPVLADALEEAGCPAEEACPACGGRGYVGGAQPATATTWRGHLCEACLGSGGPPGPNPLLAHLRGPGPHARGCWALDLVLGMS